MDKATEDILYKFTPLTLAFNDLIGEMDRAAYPTKEIVNCKHYAVEIKRRIKCDEYERTTRKTPDYSHLTKRYPLEEVVNDLNEFHDGFSRTIEEGVWKN